MSSRRSPWLTLTAILVYCFLYLPIVVLVVFAFNSSRQNVVFEGDRQSRSVRPVLLVLPRVPESGCAGGGGQHAEDRHHVDDDLDHHRHDGGAGVAASPLQVEAVSETSLYIPIVIPEIVMGIGMLVLFNALFKFINTTFDLAPAQRLGLGLGTVIVSHMAFSVPFVALTVRTRLHSFDRAVEEAAADLGANEWVDVPARDAAADHARRDGGRDAGVHAVAGRLHHHVLHQRARLDHAADLCVWSVAPHRNPGG